MSGALAMTLGRRNAFLVCLGNADGNEVAVAQPVQRVFARDGALTRAARRLAIDHGVSTRTLR